MAKSKKERKFVFNGYVNIAIQEEDVPRLQTFIADDKLVFTAMNSILLENYSIKVYFDSEKEVFRASATCYATESADFGFVLGSFSDDWYSALAVLLFKHLEIAKGDWQDYQQSTIKRFG